MYVTWYAQLSSYIDVKWLYIVHRHTSAVQEENNNVQYSVTSMLYWE